MRSYDEFLSLTEYDYKYPLGFQGLVEGIPLNGVDAIVSNNTLEHIRPNELEKGFRDTALVLRDGGIAVHVIDHQDHFAYVDNSITRLNMHKFSERTWDLITCSFNYTNRLAAREYETMLSSLALPISFQMTPIDSIPCEARSKFFGKYPALLYRERDLLISVSMLSLVKQKKDGESL